MTSISVFRENDEIIFTPEEGSVINDKQEDFVLDIQKASITIKELYQNSDNATFEKYFTQLLSLAQVGLVGQNPHLELSKKALEQLKQEIVRLQSSKIKNKYLMNLGKFCFYYSLAFSILFAVLYYIQYMDFRTKYDADSSKWKNVFLLLSGTSCGMWISATISKTQIQFEDLITIDSEDLVPHLRLIFTNIISLIFLILFYKKIITLNFSGISSNNILEDSIIALIFGLVLGLNERILGNSLLKKTKDIIS